MARITLAVTGSISAYKAADITSQLGKLGHEVTVLMTTAATQFITPLTLQVLSKNLVHLDIMMEENPASVKHIDIAKQTDIFLVAPASANTLAKLAHGLADNMVTATALALAPDVPKLVAPAMNTKMYQNPLTQDNLDRLRRYGYEEIIPREALLACGDVGRGALAEVADIVAAIQWVLDGSRSS